MTHACPLCKRTSYDPLLCRACRTQTRCPTCGGCSSCDWRAA